MEPSEAKINIAFDEYIKLAQEHYPEKFSDATLTIMKSIFSIGYMMGYDEIIKDGADNV